jgi:hypothetical protein
MPVVVGGVRRRGKMARRNYRSGDRRSGMMRRWTAS